MEHIRVTMDLEDFSKLVAGEEVEIENVRIILMDIGWHMMEAAIAGAREKVGPGGIRVWTQPFGEASESDKGGETDGERR